MPLLEIKNLSFQAGAARILDDLSLTIEAAEIYALLGTNGTGKSTLAYLVIGCEGYRPTAGTILFDGQAIQPGRYLQRMVDRSLSDRKRDSHSQGNQSPGQGDP